MITDDLLSVLVHLPTGGRIWIWNLAEVDFEPEDGMVFTYAIYEQGVVALEMAEGSIDADRLLTLAALWYGRYKQEGLRTLGPEDPRMLRAV